MKRLLLILTLAIAGPCLAEDKPVTPARTVADGPFIPQPGLAGGVVIPLYSPDSKFLNKDRLHEAEQYNTNNPSLTKLQTTLNVHNPSIEVHLAEDRTANGASVIIAPGGGHQILWNGPEGVDLVPFFAQHGISTIVLRNRLRVDGYEPTTDAVNDTFQAIRIVRSKAAEWQLDPLKIGVVGFSAGAELSAPAALFFEDFAKHNSDPSDPLAKVSPRPDYVGLVYPGPTPFTKAPETPIPGNVPPSFLIGPGSGDRVHALWATDYFTAMLKRGVPNLEMHIYGRGGHGGAISPRNGIPLGTWQDRYIEWFRDLGFLDKPGEETKAAQETADFAKKRSR